MAGGVDRAPYHSGQGYDEYSGTPIGGSSNSVGSGSQGNNGKEKEAQPNVSNGSGFQKARDGEMGADSSGGKPEPVVVTVTGGSVTESDPGMKHVHHDGTSHVHDDGHRFITFEVSLDAPAKEKLTLEYSTEDGSATADTTNKEATDFHTVTGNLVFEPGEQTKTVAVSVHPDKLVEETETFSLAVSGKNITGTLQATGTILDNDVKQTGGGMETGGNKHHGGNKHPVGNEGNNVAGNADGSDALDANLRVQSEWTGGAQLVLEVTNTSDSAYKGGWNLEFDLAPDLIQESWNGNLSEARDGKGISVSDVGWNGTLHAGQMVEVGFIINESGVDQAQLNHDADFMFL